MDRSATCEHCGAVQRVNLFDYWLGGRVSCQNCPQQYWYDPGWRLWPGIALGLPLLILSWPIIFYGMHFWGLVKGIISPDDEPAYRGRALPFRVLFSALGMLMLAFAPAFIIFVVLDSLGWI